MPKMEKVKLPTEKAQEPKEGARQPSNVKTMSPNVKGNKSNYNVSFAESAESTEKPISQSSASYKDALSQPAPGLTQKQRLQWLQKRRATGLWVQCDDCDRWRHLPYVIDSHELPKKWYCKMNPDSSLASCSAPEMPIRLRDEEDLIYSEYSAGSVVWARLPGWPWWPAMVDDCPDNEQFYWLDGFSDIPTYYNVVFFDTCDVTRAWIAPDQMKPFSTNKKSFKYLVKDRKYKSRLEVAMRQAEDADQLPLADRLAKYSFVARYKGTINKPKKINKKVLAKFKKQIKRKLNIDFSDESSDESDDFIEPRETSNKKANMNSNVIILGTPKSNKLNNIVPKVLNDAYEANEQTDLTDCATIDILGSQDNRDNSTVVKKVSNENYIAKEKTGLTECATAILDPQDNRDKARVVNKVVKEKQNKNADPDSMTVQIGSSEIVRDVVTTTATLGDQKETADSENTEKYEVRVPSPSSDDFEF